MWPAVISAGAGLLGQYMGSRQQNRNIDKTNQANIDLTNLRYKKDREMAEYAYDKNLEMWEMQNQYNSPEQQMQRFEDAGLNKHMIYGQGTPGNATSMPTMSEPSYQPPTLDYKGTRNPLGDSLASITGAGRDVLELAQEKERLDVSQVESWLAEETATDRAEIQANINRKGFWDSKTAETQSKINEIHSNMWENRISPNDPAWMRGMQKLYQENPELIDSSIKTVIDKTMEAWDNYQGTLDQIFNSFQEFKNYVKGLTKNLPFVGSDSIQQIPQNRD